MNWSYFFIWWKPTIDFLGFLENFTVFSDHLIPSSSSVNCSNKALENWQSRGVCVVLEEQRQWLPSSISEIRMRLTTCHFGAHRGGEQIIFSISPQSLLGKGTTQPNSPSPAHPQKEGRAERRYALCSVKNVTALRHGPTHWHQKLAANMSEGSRSWHERVSANTRDYFQGLAACQAQHKAGLREQLFCWSHGGWQRRRAGAREKPGLGLDLGLCRDQLLLGCVSLLCVPPETLFATVCLKCLWDGSPFWFSHPHWHGIWRGTWRIPLSAPGCSSELQIWKPLFLSTSRTFCR